MSEDFQGDPLAVETVPVAEADAAVAAPVALPEDAQPRFVVIRGLKTGVEYPIYEGENFVGRSDDKPVDIDLDDQEHQERSWISRQHTLVIFANGEVSVEDLNSANGTYVNRERVLPGQKRSIAPGDMVQVGTIHMRLEV